MSGVTHTTVPTTGTTGIHGTGATAEGTPTTTHAARTHVAEGEHCLVQRTLLKFAAKTVTPTRGIDASGYLHAVLSQAA